MHYKTLTPLPSFLWPVHTLSRCFRRYERMYVVGSFVEIFSVDYIHCLRLITWHVRPTKCHQTTNTDITSHQHLYWIHMDLHTYMWWGVTFNTYSHFHIEIVVTLIFLYRFQLQPYKMNVSHVTQPLLDRRHCGRWNMDELYVKLL